ncbi:MAG: DUF4280 domain-containing protein [Sphingobacteriaceae bacterium]|nr:MAG: DUF4280 domain-containing protein [Sphingobacteriaceae bacterium]
MSKYVPKNVKVVCSNGMTTTDLIVKNRNATIIKGQLWATIEDKPNNHGCKWLGIIAAALTALLCVLVVGTGGLAAVAIGALVGAAVATGSGFSGIPICYLATMNANWEIYHKNVFLEGKEMLLEISTLTCKVGFGGKVYIFYSEYVANKQAMAFAVRNSVEILGAAGIGAFLGSGFVIASGAGVISTQMGLHLVGFVGINYLSSKVLDSKLDSARDSVAGYLVPYKEGRQNIAPSQSTRKEAAQLKTVTGGEGKYDISDEESDMSAYKNITNQDYEEKTFSLDNGVSSLATDPMIDMYNHKDGTEKMSRAERRREYNKKTSPKKDANETLRRDPTKPKSLNDAAKRDPANVQKYKNEANKRAFIRGKEGLAKSIKKGMGEFALMLGISWAMDVLAASLQRHVDNHLDEELASRGIISVQAETI